MAEKPIIFSDNMVRALLNGRKTQMRLPVTTQTYIGDLIWVREAWAHEYLSPDPDNPDNPDPPEPTLLYRADGRGRWDGPWRSSTHMPRWASRLTLRVTDIHIQRLQDITETDACREGHREQYEPEHPETPFCTARQDFAKHRNARNTKRGYSWAANPWVAVLTFDVIKKNIDDV